MIRLNVRQRIRKLYHRFRAEDYEEFFLEMKYDEDEEDPAQMVGEPEEWEIHSDWQLDYVTSLGLEPGDRLLDVGCGPIRFGLEAIPYLEEGDYVGFDIAETAIRKARELIEEHDLSRHKPAVFCNKGYDVYFHGAFDVVWAQSVLTHLPPDHVSPFFTMVENNLDPDGVAGVTFREEDEIRESPKGTGYRYPVPWLEERLPDDLVIETVDRDTEHPDDQDALHLRIQA